MEALESEQLERAILQTALQFIPLATRIVTLDGRTILSNQAALQFQDHLGARYADEAPLDAKTFTPIPREKVPITRALRGETVFGEEYALIDPGNRLLPVLIYAAPICLEENIVAAVILVQDITALKESDRAKDEFLAVLSHELYTPLTCMLGWSQLGLDKDTHESLHQAMTIVYRNARRQQRLITELLEMSKLQHGKLECRPEDVDLGQLAYQGVENAGAAADKSGIILALSPLRDALPVSVDPQRITQCIDHLLGNSIKFTPAGGTISVSCYREGDQACVRVEDTGRGIAPEMLPTLFAPFRQVDRDERAGGLGLGLAIIRGIAELHGGTVNAESQGIGRGSAFTIKISLRQLH